MHKFVTFCTHYFLSIECYHWRVDRLLTSTTSAMTVVAAGTWAAGVAASSWTADVIASSCAAGDVVSTGAAVAAVHSSSGPVPDVSISSVPAGRTWLVGQLCPAGQLRSVGRPHLSGQLMQLAVLVPLAP